MKIRFTLTSWGQRPEVQKAWKDIAERHGLQDKEMPDPERVLAFGDGAMLGAAVVHFR